MGEWAKAFEDRDRLLSWWGSLRGMERYYRLTSHIHGGDRTKVDTLGHSMRSALSSLGPDGDVFYWSRQMLDMTSEAARDIPGSFVWTRTLWPVARGFLGFPEPIVSPSRTSATVGLSWITTRNTRRAADGHQATLHDVAEPGEAEGVLIYQWAADLDGRLLPFAAGRIIIDNTLDSLLSHLETEDELFIKAHPDADIHLEDEEDTNHRIKLLATMLRFMEQKILVAKPEPLGRSARRRLDVPPETTVNVIRLRRQEQRPSTSEPSQGPVEWSCQWVVRGFWRNQWYPTLGIHQPKYILPFIKGPSDKPLKGTGRVFAVVR